MAADTGGGEGEHGGRVVVSSSERGFCVRKQEVKDLEHCLRCWDRIEGGRKEGLPIFECVGDILSPMPESN